MSEKLSVSDMNKIILENVPMEIRKQSVYIPMVAMDCALFTIERLQKALVSLHKDSTKKYSRAIKAITENYLHEVTPVMKSYLYKSYHQKATEIYESYLNDIAIFQNQFQVIMLNLGATVSTEKEGDVLSLTYLAKELINLVIELDRDFTNIIAGYQKRSVHYCTPDNRHCKNLLLQLNGILTEFKMPLTVENKYTGTCLKVLKNKLLKINVWS